MSQAKKEIRAKFREAVFKRDGYKCKVCGIEHKEMDAHHIIIRTDIDGQGYVPENGISLCPEDHIKAEHYYDTGIALPGFSPDDLFKLIGSSEELAREKAKKLK